VINVLLYEKWGEAPVNHDAVATHIVTHYSATASNKYGFVQDRA